MTLHDDIGGSAPQRLTPLVLRSAIGGVLMGMANLVPGISGGTMLLASGVYPRFITAVSEVSRFRFRTISLLVLGTVTGMALLSIVSLAGGVKMLMLEHRWVMYSLFIGLTLGGVPVVWSMGRPASRATWVGAGFGFAAMAALAWAQASGAGAADDHSSNMPLMFLAGIVGAAAMILPGISGAYMLLVLGVYVTILGAVDAVKQAVLAGDWATMSAPVVNVVLPVGVGVLVGVATISNLLRWLMAKFEKLTLGILLGLLVGAVVGLWPFQRPVKPMEGQVVHGRVMTAELIESLDPGKYPTEFFAPTFGQWAAALLIAAAGFAMTAALAAIGRAGGRGATASDSTGP
jgi:putative membrane protein